MTTIDELYRKYYTKQKKGFLAYLEWTTSKGIKICIGCKENRKLMTKVGNGRWCVKHRVLGAGYDPMEQLLKLKQSIQPELDSQLERLSI